MNRSLTSLFAAFEALLVVAIGIGISLAPLTILWGVQYGFGPDWWGFWRAAVDIWLLGHGVDVTITLDAAVAAATGFPAAAAPFPITVAALGFGLLTVLLGMRAGRRIAQTTFRLTGELVALGVFAALALGVTASAQYEAAQPNFVQGIVLPTLVFAVGLGIGSFRSPRAGGDPLRKVLTTWLDELRPSIYTGLTSALRGGLSAAGVVIATASVLLAIVVVTSYAQMIALYEGLQAGALGGFALTLAQIAFIPNLVLWVVSWLVGPGFAIGTGSSVSPLATNLGPIPAVPVLGALPTGESAFAFVGILVPVLAGFLAGALLHRQASAPGIPRILAIGVGMGLAAGSSLGLLTWAASGSAGPGRLVTVGPDPLQVALWAALEVGVAACIGLFAATRMPFRHPDDTSTPPLGTTLPGRAKRDSAAGSVSGSAGSAGSTASASVSAGAGSSASASSGTTGSSSASASSASSASSALDAARESASRNLGAARDGAKRRFGALGGYLGLGATDDDTSDAADKSHKAGSGPKTGKADKSQKAGAADTGYQPTTRNEPGKPTEPDKPNNPSAADYSDTTRTAGDASKGGRLGAAPSDKSAGPGRYAWAARAAASSKSNTRSAADDTDTAPVPIVRDERPGAPGAPGSGPSGQ
jgi:hypothetical protein